MPRSKRDPLIAAMIAKLPDGDEWPVERQLAWLHLMAMAFGTVYGGDAAARLGNHVHELVPPTFKPSSKPLVVEPKRFPFYIDLQGNALNQHGKPVKASEVRGDLVDLRGQDGDMKTIIWADGSMGLNGADLTIVSV